MGGNGLLWMLIECRGKFDCLSMLGVQLKLINNSDGCKNHKAAFDNKRFGRILNNNLPVRCMAHINIHLLYEMNNTIFVPNLNQVYAFSRNVGSVNYQIIIKLSRFSLEIGTHVYTGLAVRKVISYGNSFSTLWGFHWWFS